jgi:hypothetical protein
MTAATMQFSTGGVVDTKVLICEIFSLIQAKIFIKNLVALSL